MPPQGSIEPQEGVKSAGMLSVFCPRMDPLPTTAAPDGIYSPSRRSAKRCGSDSRVGPTLPVRSGPPQGWGGPGRGTRLPEERLSLNNLTKPGRQCGSCPWVADGGHAPRACGTRPDGHAPGVARRHAAWTGGPGCRRVEPHTWAGAPASGRAPWDGWRGARDIPRGLRLYGHLRCGGAARRTRRRTAWPWRFRIAGG
jgi:hypothetical protein